MASSICQLVSKKLVKPYLSTAPSLRNYKLSLIDQVTNKMYIPLAFFYPECSSNTTSQISSLLEESLSKALASYYPFAGRLADDGISIDCNDMGATFSETRIGCSMSEILKDGNDLSARDIVFPRGLPWTSISDQPSLVVAQLSHFDCGGKALSVSMTHKIGDAHTLCNFIKDWAAIARQSIEKPSPQFIGSSILPPIDDPSIGFVNNLKQGQHCITRRYVFHPEKVNQLKAKAADELGVVNPTRVEVVSAILYKSAMAASLECSGSFKPSLLSSMLNMRSLIGPPVTENYVGNFSSIFSIMTNHAREMNFSKLVGEIRREKYLHYEKYKATKTSHEFLSAALEKVQQLQISQSKNDTEEYHCSSVCRFPTYDIDFGWGRPTKVSVATPPFENYFLLMDNHNADGIEVSVTLPEQKMSLFQSDPGLLAFVSTDSSF